MFVDWKIKIVNVAKLSKAIYRFNATSTKISKTFKKNSIKNNSKISMKPQNTQKSKTILRKKNKGKSIILSDFKLHHKAIVINILVLV